MRRVVAVLASSSLLAAGLTLLVGTTAGAAAGATTRVSISSTGAQANAASRLAAVSGDGRFVAFDSAASTLVADDTNGVGDVFVRDRLSATTTRISVSTAGAQSNAASDSASISRDGRFVAFMSTASNLVSDDTNGVRDVFVHDRATATTTRASLTASGAQAAAQSFAPQISGDGRYVVFHTFADLAGSGASTGQVNAYRVDRATGQVDDLCARSDGTFIRLCLAPSVSHDGRYVAFEAQGRLTADDTNDVTDIYVRDMTGLSTTRASVTSSGAQPNGHSTAPSIAANGGVLVFTSAASNMVDLDLNALRDVFVRDLVASTTERVTVGVGGAQSNGDSVTRGSSMGSRSVSEDGRHVVFHSFASNLVDADTNASADVFVRDRTLGTTSIASLTPDDQPAGLSSDASISADGRFVTFTSLSAILVTDDTNGVADVFIRDLRSNTPPTLSLPGDVQVYLADGLSVTGSFSDPDLDQAWSGTVTYGDGTAAETLVIRTDKTFALVHLYADLGVYSVQVTLTDGAGGSATGSFNVTVVPTPVTYTDAKAGISLVVQLDERAPDFGRVWVTVPGTGTYTFDAAAALRRTSPTTVMIDYAGPAVLETAAGNVPLSVQLKARLDPSRHIGEGTLTDSEGRRFHVVATP